MPLIVQVASFLKLFWGLMSGGGAEGVMEMELLDLPEMELLLGTGVEVAMVSVDVGKVLGMSGDYQGTPHLTLPLFQIPPHL